MFILLHFPGRLICAEGSTKVLKEWSKPKTAPGWIRGICSHKLAMRILIKRPWSMSASGINTDGKISNFFNMTIDASLCILPLTLISPMLLLIWTSYIRAWSLCFTFFCLTMWLFWEVSRAGKTAEKTSCQKGHRPLEKGKKNFHRKVSKQWKDREA